MKTIFLHLMLFLLLVQKGTLGQTVFNKEKEIRQSGKYLYGEIIGLDSNECKRIATINLMTKIANAYLDKQIPNFSNDSSVIIKEVSYYEVPFGKKIKFIAYVPMNYISTLKKTMKVVEMQYTNSKVQSTIGKNLLDTLSSFKKAEELLQFLRIQANRNRLGYSYKENLVINPNDCYIACVKSNSVIALLSKGNNIRTDLNSGMESNNFKNDYINSKYIWIYVY